MPIWIDADACPKVIKEILFRTANRTKTTTQLVANHFVPAPPSPYIKQITVSGGFDEADKYIVLHMNANDLVITADIPLADLVVTKGGFALNPRGELYTLNNIKQHLSIRNHNETLRGGGMISGGPAKLGAKEVQRFANQLDKWVTNQHKF